jgi:predicted ATPase/DNA-binding CsgD family transcriptional regulator
MSDLHAQGLVENLTPREVEILGLVSEGLSNRAIANRLFLSLDTIKWYNKQIFGKLGVKNRTQAVKKAREYRLFETQQPPDTEDKRALTNLPAPLNSFVGRENEITEIKGLLETKRLVVLTGTGGSGKTRLALKVTRELAKFYRDGTWLVELESVKDPTMVTDAIAQVLKVFKPGDVPLVEVLKRFLARKHLLLVLDNFEHLLEAASLVGELLAVAPQITVLATSRERLHIYGEHEYPVQPLSVPNLSSTESPEQLNRYDSIRLFVERAQAVQPGFTLNDGQASAVAKICARLDGLPLAIELAASQVKTQPPGVLVERLGDVLDALPRGPRDLPARQRTLRATIEWSYELLNSNEKILFSRLAVFNGGGTLDAITSICEDQSTGKGMNLLTAMVEKNLVYPRQGGDGELRFMMLNTIHEYAAKCLQANGEAERILNRHAVYFTRLAETAAIDIRGPKQNYWFLRLRAEQDNLRSVFTWSFSGSEVEYGLRLAAALRDYWYYSGLGVEGWHWTHLALGRSNEGEPALRAAVLHSAGQISYIIAEFSRGKSYLKKALHLYNQLGDERNIAWSLVELGGLYMENEDEYAEGISLVTQGLAILREVDDKPGIAYALNLLGELARLQGDYQSSERYYLESLAVVKETGERMREGILLSNLCFIAYHQKNYQLAKQHIQEALFILWELNRNYRLAVYFGALAGPTVGLGNPSEAAQLLAVSHTQVEAMGARIQPADLVEHDRIENEIRSQLGEQDFLEEWRLGQEMSLEEALSMALSDFEPGEGTLERGENC